MKGSSEAHGKTKVAKKVSFLPEFDQPDNQDKTTMNKSDHLKVANSRDGMPSNG